MPSDQDQNARQNCCVLPSMVFSSAKSLYAFDDDSGENLEVVFAHICIPW